MKKLISLSICLLAFAGVSGVFAGGSSDYPAKNINAIVPYSPGGPTDMSVRGLLDVAGGYLPSGTAFVVANHTGAGGLVGMTDSANSKPDGYNIGVIAVDLLMHYNFGRTKLTLANYIPLVCTMADPYGLVVSGSARYKTVPEFIKYAKDNPGKVTVGNSGVGAAPHLAAVAFEQAFGVSFNHVPYNGSADCIAAIAGGHLDATFTQPSPAKSQMAAGTLKMLGILDAKRMASFPDIPTVSETNPIDFSMRGWVVIVAPVGTAQAQVDYLADVFGKTIKTQKFKDVITSLGMQPIEVIGKDLAEMVKKDEEFYKKLCATIEIKQ